MALTRNQKIQIIHTICDSAENRCTIECIARVENEAGYYKDIDLYTDEEIDRCLWEIFKACGITYQPQEREHNLIAISLYNMADADKFTNALNAQVSAGYKIENCGVNSSAIPVAWAITSRAKV